METPNEIQEAINNLLQDLLLWEIEPQSFNKADLVIEFASLVAEKQREECFKGWAVHRHYDMLGVPLITDTLK